MEQLASPDICFKLLILFVWSGRRPFAPKTFFSCLSILPVFDYLRFRQLRPS